MRTCLFCGVELTGKKRKYCCNAHSNRWRYHADPLAKERTRKYMEKYRKRLLETNPEKLKEIKRKSNAAYRKKLYADPVKRAAYNERMKQYYYKTGGGSHAVDPVRLDEITEAYIKHPQCFVKCVNTSLGGYIKTREKQRDIQQERNQKVVNVLSSIFRVFSADSTGKS